MKKILLIISIISLILLPGCGNKGSELEPPEGMTKETFGYGYSAYKMIEDYLNEKASAEDTALFLEHISEKMGEIELAENDEGYGYNLSVSAYIDQAAFYMLHGTTDDVIQVKDALKDVLQLE